MRATRGTTRWRQGLAALTAALVASAGLSVVTARADVVWPPSPTTIPGSTESPDSPQVASLGGNGDAVAVWETCGCSSAGVQAAVFDGSSWSTAQTISTPGAANAFEPQITATSPGHAVAVWTQDDGTDLTVQAATFDGSTWSAPLSISGASTDVAAPQVAGRPDGSAVAVWDTADVTAFATDIQSATFNGTTWAAPLTLTAGNNSVQPQVATTNAGTAVAVWSIGGCLCLGTIQTSTFASGAWSTPTDLTPASVDAVAPALTATSGGAAVATWVNVTNTPAVLEARMYDGSTWAPVETVSDPTEDVFPASFFDFSPPQLTSTAAGRATVVWVGLDTVTSELTVLASEPSDGGWTLPVPLSAPLSTSDGIYLTPDITTVAPGVALAVWQRTDDTSSTLQAATFDGTTVTGPANVATAHVGLLALPQVAGTGDGTAVTVWVDDIGLSTLSIQGALGAPSAVTKPGPGGDATLSTSAGGFLHVKHSAVPASPAPPAGVQFPYGLLSFDIVNLPTPGASATVTVTLPGPVTQYWKLQHDTWTQLTNATFSTNHVSFTLTDGGIGDADGVANSVIVDPGAPAVVLPRITFTG